MNKKNLIISASSMDTMSLCNRKFMFEKSLGIAPKIIIGSKDDHNATLGSLLHKCLELHYTLKFKGVNLEDIIKHTMVYCRYYGKSKLSLLDESIETVTRIYRDYAFYYKFEKYETNSIEDRPLIEVPFAKVLYEDEKYCIIIEGVIDWLISNHNIDMVVDHKGSSYWKDPAILTNQFFTYSWVTGRKIVVVNKISLELKGKDEDRFKRIPFEIPERLLAEWLEDRIYYAKRIIECEEKSYFPADFTSCNRFIKYPCAFQRICESEPKYRPAIIDQHYEKKQPFNPLKDKEGLGDYLKEIGIE